MNPRIVARLYDLEDLKGSELVDMSQDYRPPQPIPGIKALVWAPALTGFDASLRVGAQAEVVFEPFVVPDDACVRSATIACGHVLQTGSTAS